MSEKGRKITSKQRTAIRGLLEGKKFGVVADSVGISPRTLYRWFQNERFTSELHKAEVQVLDAVGLRLVSLAGDAVDALEKVLNEPSVRGASVKRLTAVNILEMVLKWRDMVDFDTRLTNLEGKVFNGK